MTTPKLTIIFVNYKMSKDIDRCLGSIEAHENNYNNYEILIVDNNSNDRDLLTLLKKYPNIKIIDAKKNGGFAYGNNIGLKEAKGKYIFLLNPDTYIKDNSIEKLLVRIEQNDIDIIGPKLLYPDGRNQSFYHPKSYLTLWKLFCERFFLHRIFVKNKRFNSYFRTYMDYDKEASVEQICGAAILLKRNIIKKIGYMDERYFMYFEESDWCYQAVKKKCKLLYYPNAIVYHAEGQTDKKKLDRASFYYMKSFKYYFKKNFKILFIPRMINLIGLLIRIFGKNGDYYNFFLKHW